MLPVNHVNGKKNKSIFIYTLSTCIWCKKTKKLLNELGIAYDYIDADLLEDKDRGKAAEEMKKYCEYASYPTVIIDNKECIQGYEPEKIRELLGL